MCARMCYVCMFFSCKEERILPIVRRFKYKSNHSKEDPGSYDVMKDLVLNKFTFLALLSAEEQCHQPSLSSFAVSS